MKYLKSWRLVMARQRKRHSAEFKARVALEAAKDIKTLNELASQYGVHQTQISQWKKQLLDGIADVFSKQKKSVDTSKQIDDLYRQIGEVTVERDWLKKNCRAFHRLQARISGLWASCAHC